MLHTGQFKEWVQATGVRVAKILGLGGALTLKEAMPFGVDGNPPKDMTAIYGFTPNSKQRYVIGYLNKNQLAETGESRLYSVDANGNLKAYIWNKADGTLELNGNTYSAVRYQTLNTQLQSEISQINSQLTAIQAAITSVGGTYVPTPINVDFSGAESPDVKLK